LRAADCYVADSRHFRCCCISTCSHCKTDWSTVRMALVSGTCRYLLRSCTRRHQWTVGCMAESFWFSSRNILRTFRNLAKVIL